MSSEQAISIGIDSQRRADHGAVGPVSMPVDELLTGNGLVTGQSGADPAETARLIAEGLLDVDETVLLVDPAGAFDALTDHAAVLHVGGDRNCDVEVRRDAVDRVASLAINGDTSILLDLAAFDASAADDVLGGLTNALVDEHRDRDSNLLVIANECERWLSANGPATRTGENMIALGGRRNAAVGILGVTDQPADLREEVLHGVDWLLAQRLTWREDVAALEQLLDGEYVDELEDLADDEGFLNAGWDRGVTKLRIGADSDATDAPQSIESTGSDGEVPAEELLASIPEARSPAETDDDGGVNDPSIDALETRIASLEAKLDAREDIETLADRIAEAIVDGLEDAQIGPSTHQDHSGATSAGRSASQTGGDEVDDSTDGMSSTRRRQSAASSESSTGAPADAGKTGTAASAASNDAGSSGDDSGAFGDMLGMFDDDDTAETSASADGGATEATSTDETLIDSNAGSSSNGSGATDGTSPPRQGSAEASTGTETDADRTETGGMSFEPIDFGFTEPSQGMDSTMADDFGPPARRETAGRTIPRYLRTIVRNLEEMDATTRRMLAYYIDVGADEPLEAHVSAGGAGDRTHAYAHNRQLRTNGLIEHLGQGEYGPRLREYVVDQAGHSVPEHELDRAVSVITQTVEAA